jgi:hypothetical protein
MAVSSGFTGNGDFAEIGKLSDGRVLVKMAALPKLPKLR